LEFALLGIQLKASFCRLKLVFAVLTEFVEKPVAPFGFVRMSCKILLDDAFDCASSFLKSSTRRAATDVFA